MSATSHAYALGDDIPKFGSQHLRISHTDIKKEEIDQIGALFQEYPNMRTLKLVSSRFTSLELAIAFGKKIRNSPLLSLYILSVPLVEEAIRCLCTSIQETGLRVLELTGTGVTDNGAKILAHALRHCYVLHHLCLKNNQIGRDGGFALASVIPESSLITLELSGNPFGTDVMSNLILAPCSLKTLKVGYTMMEQEGFQSLCAAIAQHGVQLETFDVEGNRINNVDCVCQVVQACRGLRTLNLGDNQIADLTSFSSAVQQSMSLEKVFLDRNPLLMDAAVELFLSTAVVYHPTLQVVLLDSTGTSNGMRNQVNDRLKRLNCKRTNALFAICSGKNPRFGYSSAVGRSLPVDLIRLVGEFLPL